jgi:acyl-CoA synthetase (AMP-forming)/AMP-acid ligase II
MKNYYKELKTMNVGYILTRTAKNFPEREALVVDGQRLTYRELNERVNQLANSLLAHGLNKGDRVGLLFYNSLAYFESYLALYKAGLVWVRLNYRLSVAEMANMMQDSQASALIHGPEFGKAADEVHERIPGVKLRIHQGKGPGLGYEELLSAGSKKEPSVVVNEEDLSDIWYTSGTTGEPKGIMITHRNILTCVQFLLSDVYWITEDDKLLTVGALSHAGAVRVLPFLLRGALNVLHRSFDPREIFRTIEKEKVTDISTVPTMLLALMDHPERRNYDLSSLKTITYAGAPTPVERIKEAVNVFGPILDQSFGQAESIITITHLPKHEHIFSDDPEREKRLASVGREYPGVQVKVVNEKDEECASGEIGEVITKSDLIMKGYWNRPEQTAEALKGGWLYTGDLGYQDDKGYLYLMDRKHGKIITGGLNVYPREIEEVLAQHEAIAEACVFGIPDSKWGEAVTAAVALRAGADTSEQALIEFCKSRIASYKTPKKVYIIDRLPKNAYGKILQRELKERFSS